MGLNKFSAPPSGRMGIIRALSSIRKAAVLEFGTMGHMLYASGALARLTGRGDEGALFSTHVSETEIALGSTVRIGQAVKALVESGYTSIFLVPSAVGHIIGIDFKAIAARLQKDYPGIFICGFDVGFDAHSNQGICNALKTLVMQLPEKREKADKPSYNILGSCADMYRFAADTKELERLLLGAFGARPVCVLTADTDVAGIKNIPSAHVNIVLRHEALPAAEILKRNFDMPYVYFPAYGIEGTSRWLSEVAKAAGFKLKQRFINSEIAAIGDAEKFARNVFAHCPDFSELSLFGHFDTVYGIMSFGCGELGMKKGFCACDAPVLNEASSIAFFKEQLVNVANDVPFAGEEVWTNRIPLAGGILMAGEEALRLAGKNDFRNQIAHPSYTWRVANPYQAPFMGFRGAMNLIELWTNEVMDRV